MDWSPISTAPRDGTPIFITAPYSRSKMEGGPPVAAVWAAHAGRAGMWATIDKKQVHGYLTMYATHWAPVPPGPGEEDKPNAIW